MLPSTSKISLIFVDSLNFERKSTNSLSCEEDRYKIKTKNLQRTTMEYNTRWGQTTPCLCASRVGRFFQNGAEKVCKGLWVSPYWISALKRSTLIQFCRNLVRAMQIWRPFQEIANFYLSVDIYQG